jgi:heptaprenyl diphosphate synthase
MAASNPLTVIPSMAGDLERVQAELELTVQTANDFLTEIASHLITAGGKRIRPGFAVAAAATGLRSDSPAADDVIRGGAAVELVHLGSLYHDDVIDSATTRHFVPSVNSLWGNHKAILAGDFLLARASEIAASLGTEVAGLLGATISRLVDGQIRELQALFDPSRTEESALASIEGKTAALLATAARTGAIVGGLERDRIDLLTEFGRRYGLAFQIVDDVLDLVSSAADLGKPAGHDIEEGVYTLPVIRALQTSVGDELRSLLVAGIQPEPLQRAVDLVRGSGAVGDAIAEARAHTDAATAILTDLPPSPGARGLQAAADYLVLSVESAAERALR